MYIKIKNLLKQQPSYIKIFVAVIFLSTWLYWSEMRPTLIRKGCFREASDERYADPSINWSVRTYNMCLVRNGFSIGNDTLHP